MLAADELIDTAMAQTGLDDFGGESFREGLTRLTEALAGEADLTETGEHMLRARLGMLLANRLRIEQVYRAYPEIDDERIDRPLFIIGLPRTGTTALSQLLSADPQIRSLRLWESSDPVPPPEAASQHTDPRIAEAQRGLDAMYEAFPRMRALYFQTATGATECQDLLGMEFRTSHFDGMAHVPSYIDWVVNCDMVPAYCYHIRTLKLLQWRCPPRLWHLKTPVHALALDQLASVYPNARFLWTHRDPAAVLGSVCSLMAYTRSWVSDRDDAAGLGAQQTELWGEALRRAIAFRDRVGEGRFADIPFDELNADPVGTVAGAYARLGLEMNEEGRERMGQWATENPAGGRGAHTFSLAEFGLDATEVRARFGFYLDRFEVRYGNGQ
jgi:hypothetical protein